MAHNASFVYDINAEHIVDDLLADESYTEERITVEVEEGLPLVAICCFHQPQELFCTSCLSENCQFCTFNFHLGHPIIPLEEAFSKANFIRESLTMEANNILYDIDNASKSIQDKIDNLLRGSFDACLEISEDIKRSPTLSKPQEDEIYANIINSTRSKETLFRDELSQLYTARQTAMQTAYFLSTEPAFSISNQLSINDKALVDLNQCRCVINKVFKTSAQFASNVEALAGVNRTSFVGNQILINADQNIKVTDNNLAPYFENNTIETSSANSPSYLPNQTVLHHNDFLIGLPVLPLSQVFERQNNENLEDGGALTSGYNSGFSSEAGSSNSCSPEPEIKSLYQPIVKILRRGEIP